MDSSLRRKVVLAIANSYDWVRETGQNKGEAVKKFLSVCGLKEGYPWCAAFVAFVGRADKEVSWPLPPVAGCVSLYDAAKAKGFVHSEPESGAVFLLWYPKMNRFAHTGFVVQKDGNGWLTIEGNTSDPSTPSRREGWGCFARHRTFTAKDRFILWWL